MATITATPATPVTPLPAAPTPPQTTGTWQHPRIAEIERRREASTMTKSKGIRAIILVATLLASFSRPGAWLRTILSLVPVPSTLTPLMLAAIRILLAFAIATTVSPMWAPPDRMEDIPLTPTQRKLLGLTPSSSLPPTPTAGGAYITPPRYARNTPRSDSSRAAVAGSSPVGPGSGTPYHVSGNGSPLARKAIEGRRFSSGGGSPMGSSLFDESGSGVGRGSPETFSPTGKSASVTLNNRWLYQRGSGKSRMSGGLY